ncbi:MAG: hypothetical protein HGA76_11505 [Candidatus Firestonebacteria bacterium]|nr:hypothetical protein [Candidatus Firestonebacteria bacterium]
MQGVEVAVAASPAWSEGLIWSALISGAMLLVVFVLVAWRLRNWRGISGVESLEGAQGTVKTVTPDGVIVHVRSDDWWVLEAPVGLRPGQKVEVVAVEGLRVRVRSLEAEKTESQKRGGKA